MKCKKCLGQKEFVDCSEDNIDGVEIILCKECNGKGEVDYVRCSWCSEIYNPSEFCCPRCQQQDYETIENG